MITCIICSRDADLLQAAKLNISKTIGTAHEIIAIDNSAGQMSISQAYNKGADAAQYHHLVFVHEDVVFHTTEWGIAMLHQFAATATIGCLSVAGGIYKTKAPSHWITFAKGYEQLDISYLIQQYKNGEKTMRDTWPDKAKQLHEVVLLDGVFIAIDKRTGIRFDESLPGFHCYDLSVSLNALQKGYKNFVTREILLEHLSSGSFNGEWIKAIHHFHLQHADQFPKSISTVQVNSNDLEKKTMTRFIELAYITGQQKIGLYWWKKLFISHPFSKLHFYLGKVFLWNRRQKNKTAVN